jgi:hypothetical protein
MALILVEMLSGSPVVDGEGTYANILAHASGSLELPETLARSPLGPVLERALAYDHEDRYPNAGAFASALTTVHPGKVPDVTERDSWVALGTTPSGEMTARAPQHLPRNKSSDSMGFDTTTAFESVSVPDAAPPARRQIGSIAVAILGAVMLLLAVVLVVVTSDDAPWNEDNTTTGAAANAGHSEIASSDTADVATAHVADADATLATADAATSDAATADAATADTTLAEPTPRPTAAPGDLPGKAEPKGRRTKAPRPKKGRTPKASGTPEKRLKVVD